MGIHPLEREYDIMKKTICLAAISVLLFTLAIQPASAATTAYSFAEPQIALGIDQSVYETVLTPENLAEHEDFLLANGYTVEGMTNIFNSNGYLVYAVDAENNRTLVLSAQITVDSEMYFDLNEQDSEMRKDFRTSHRGEAYSLLGYSYSDAVWKNYGGALLRFLCTKYSFSENGEIEHRGYQRKTIRNGYTIILDMQVRDRDLKSADEKALETAMENFSFITISPMPLLPAKLSIPSEPPSATSSDSFTIKGTTEKKGTVTVTVVSLTSSSSSVFTGTANSSGSFSVKVTLPEPGIFSVVVEASADNSLKTQFSYTVNYQGK